MNPGQLNRRIVIQSSTLAPDTNGDATQTWTTVYSCWANIDVQNSQLTYSTAEFVSETTYRFTIRYASSITLNPAMRIQYVDPGGVTHTYEIKAVVDMKQGHQFVLILAYENEGVVA